MELQINSAEQMMELGEQIGRKVQDGDVIYLAGELGLGKTTLAKGIGRGLECEESITSPTFTIMNIYQGRLTMYHCDFYRLSGDDVEQLGIKEIIGIQGLFVVEWAAMVNSDLLPEGLNIAMELAGDDYDGPRKLILTASGIRGIELLKGLETCQYWR